jgi:hypothetical protein
MPIVTQNGAVVSTADTVDAADVSYIGGIAVRASDGAMHVTSGLTSAQLDALAGLDDTPPTIGPLSVQPRTGTTADLTSLAGLAGEISYPNDTSNEARVWHNGSGTAKVAWRNGNGGQVSVDTTGAGATVSFGTRPYKTLTVTGTGSDTVVIGVDNSLIGHSFVVRNMSSASVDLEVGGTVPTLAAGYGQQFTIVADSVNNPGIFATGAAFAL